MRRKPHTPTIVAAIAAIAFTVSGCGLPTLPGLPGLPIGGDSTSGVPLWPDVPPVPGSAPVAGELPLPVKLVIKGYLNTAGSHLDEGRTAKDFDARLYQVPSGTDISSFYTQDLMSANGWRSDAQCQAILPFCIFKKPASGGFTDAVMILSGDAANTIVPESARPSDPNEAGIIYVRLSLKDDGQGSGGEGTSGSDGSGDTTTG